MVDCIGNGEEISSELLKTSSRCKRLRTWFLLLLVFSLTLFYYLNSSDVRCLQFLSRTIQKIYNNTFEKRASPVKFRELSLQATNATNATNLSANKENISHIVEACTAEIPYHVAYPCRYHYTVNEPERCQKDRPFLVLMVPVHPSNREARDAVRHTWGSEKSVMNKVVSLFFLLGQGGTEEQQQKVLQESEEYHDIVQSDFLDSYKNLTIKTMVILEWLEVYCQNATYAMKIDSDVFLNLDVLINMLLHAPRENYMTGLVAKDASVRRESNSKWFLPKTAFPEDSFPPYALGLGYVMSLDLPKKLHEAASHVKAVYIEDVYLGLCMRYLGIPFTSQADGGLFNVLHVPYNRCHYSKLIATITLNLQEQVSSWVDLKKPGPPC